MRGSVFFVERLCHEEKCRAAWYHTWRLFMIAYSCCLDNHKVFGYNTSVPKRKGIFTESIIFLHTMCHSLSPSSLINN